MLISLFTGGFFLIKDKGKTKRTAYSLGIRVSIAVMLFATIFYGGMKSVVSNDAIQGVILLLGASVNFLYTFFVYIIPYDYVDLLNYHLFY